MQGASAALLACQRQALAQQPPGDSTISRLRIVQRFQVRSSIPLTTRRYPTKLGSSAK
jgi:hypothetical protein